MELEDKVFFQKSDLSIRVIGDSPLIMSWWKDRREGVPFDKKIKSNPVRDYVDSLYWLGYNGEPINPPRVRDYEDEAEGQKEYERIQKIASCARFGAPAAMFRSCAFDAGYMQGRIPKKTAMYGRFCVMSGFAEIKGIPEIMETVVRTVGNSEKEYPCCKAVFKEWSTELTIQYRTDAISVNEIIELFSLGGSANGVGDWRPSRGGTMGRFHVQSA